MHGDGIVENVVAPALAIELDIVATRVPAVDGLRVRYLRRQLSIPHVRPDLQLPRHDQRYLSIKFFTSGSIHVVLGLVAGRPAEYVVMLRRADGGQAVC